MQLEKVCMRLVNSMRVKKILASALMTGAMLSTMVAPAMAATITMDGTGSEFKAYKLMNLSTSIKSTCTHLDEETGALKEGAKHTDDCYAYRYEVNSKYADALRAVALSDWDKNSDGVYSDAELLDGLRALKGNAAGMRDFADDLYEQQIKGKLDADATATGKTFTGADQGYYLIEESVLDEAGNPDAKSLVMLDTLGQEDITVPLKEGVPTLTKKIKLEDGTLVDAVDAAYGDTVTFQLTVGMPDNIEDTRNGMKFTVHDNAEGLDLSATTVSVTKVSGETSEAFTGGTYALAGEDATDECEMHYDFTVTRDMGVKAGDTFVIEYTGKLNKGMQSVKTGNTNDAYLEFTADPYNLDGDKDTTPLDKVTVLTYKMTVNKKDEEGAALKGAQFQLFKKGADGEYAATALENDVNVVSTVDGEVTFNFAGLDAGSYKLVESTVPAGYNKADDFEFTIEAEYSTDSAEPVLTSFKVLDAEGNEIDAAKVAVSEDGTLSTDVINTTGIKLPSTGGAGVYALYIGGALLLVGAGVAMVVLNSKKNKKNTNEE